MPAEGNARRGPARIGEDPFWSVVRRRHRDVDLVIVDEPDPPGRRHAQRVGAQRVSAQGATAPRSAETFDRAALDLWASLLPGTAPRAEHRWIGAGASEQRESTLTLTGIEVGRDMLATAEQTLRDHGWQVLVPPHGLPRVLADRESTTLALVRAAPGRTVLRVRTPVERGPQ